MDFSPHIRSVDHIRKQITISLEREWVRQIRLETEKDREDSVDKISAIRNKLQDLEKSADDFIRTIKALG